MITLFPFPRCLELVGLWHGKLPEIRKPLNKILVIVVYFQETEIKKYTKSIQAVEKKPTCMTIFVCDGCEAFTQSELPGVDLSVLKVRSDKDEKVAKQLSDACKASVTKVADALSSANGSTSKQGPLLSANQRIHVSMKIEERFPVRDPVQVNENFGKSPASLKMRTINSFKNDGMPRVNHPTARMDVDPNSTKTLVLTTEIGVIVDTHTIKDRPVSFDSQSQLLLQTARLNTLRAFGPKSLFKLPTDEDYKFRAQKITESRLSRTKSGNLGKQGALKEAKVQDMGTDLCDAGPGEDGSGSSEDGESEVCEHDEEYVSDVVISR